jgi:hypothetical protein
MAHANCEMGSRDPGHFCWRLAVHDRGSIWPSFVWMVHCLRRCNNRADWLVFLGYKWLCLCSDRLFGWRIHWSVVDGFVCSTGRALYLVVAIAVYNHFRTCFFRLTPCAWILGCIKLGRIAIPPMGRAYRIRPQTDNPMYGNREVERI